jgi:hypothetical protein
MAAGVGLFARYRIVAEHYGLYAGLGFVAGFLIVTALVLLLAAHTEAQKLSNLRVFSKSSSGSLHVIAGSGGTRNRGFTHNCVAIAKRPCGRGKSIV